MDRIAVFVDAGYLFAAGGEALTGNAVKRTELKLDHDALLDKLKKLAKEASGGIPLLRIYWYDGTSGRPTAVQTAVGVCESVKLRLGLLNAAGQQKGVDSLIVTDMIALARNHAMADALLVSGDEDVRVGVQQAQEWGVRVYLLGIASGRHNQSPTLQQEADSTFQWDKNDVAAFLQHSPAPPILPGSTAPAAKFAAAAVGGTSVEEIAVNLAATIPLDQLAAVGTALRTSTPPEWDRLLIRNAIAALGQDPVEQETKRQLRREFKQAVKKRLGT